MIDPLLQEHYERKYAEEAQGGSHAIVTGWQIPNDRYKAAVYLMHRYFRGGRILELGAGDGMVARTLIANGLPFDGYVVSDLSHARTRGMAQSFTDPRVQATQIDAEDMPQDVSGGFDAVLMVALIEHLIDPITAMKKIRGVLRPGGFVCIDTPNIAKWTRRLKLVAGRFPSTAARDEGLRTYDNRSVTLYDEGHLHYFTYRSLERMLTEYCGYTRTVRFGYNFGQCPIGNRLGFELAQRWPALLSDIALLAYV